MIDRSKGLEVVVIGAGIGGLAASLALRQQGHRVTVLEQAPAVGEVGAGIQVAPNASRILIDLGLRRKIEDAVVGPEVSLRRRWEDGRIVAEYPLGRAVEERYGAPYWHAHRADLQEALLEAAVDRSGPGHPVVIRLGVAVTALREGSEGVQASATSSVGESWSADLIVGADGIHSTARELLFEADEPVFSGDMAYRALVSVDSLPDTVRAMLAQPSMTVWMGPGRHLVHYLVRQKTLLNLVAIVPGTREVRESWSAVGEREGLVAEFDGWAPVVREIVSSVETVNCWALYERTPLVNWAKGRVALLGDSCHAMLPYQAQGAAQAIEDAAMLAKLTSFSTPAEVPEALGEYERLRRERAAQVHGASRQNQVIFHLPDGAEQRERDAEMAAMSGQDGGSDWLWRYDVAAAS